jgi:hypothetical protein
VCEDSSSKEGLVRSYWRFLLIFVTSTPLWAGLATAYQDGAHFYIENDALKIAVLRDTGTLDGIIHKQSGVNLQSRTLNYFPATWGISLNTAGGTNIYVNSAQAISFSGAIHTTAAGADLSLSWKGFQYLPNGLPSIADAVVTAQISVRTDSPLSYWTIQASGLGANSVSFINFSSITGIGPLGQSGADDMLLTSEFKGMLYHDPTANAPAGSSSWSQCRRRERARARCLQRIRKTTRPEIPKDQSAP